MRALAKRRAMTKSRAIAVDNSPTKHGLGQLARLPLEIRQQIWRYFRPCGPLWPQEQLNKMTLLRVSRLMHDEASAQIYSNMTVQFWIVPDWQGQITTLVTTNDGRSWHMFHSGFRHNKSGLRFDRIPWHKLQKVTTYIDAPERGSAYQSLLLGCTCRELIEELHPAFVKNRPKITEICLTDPAQVHDTLGTRPWPGLDANRIGLRGHWDEKSLTSAIVYLSPLALFGPCIRIYIPESVVRAVYPGRGRLPMHLVHLITTKRRIEDEMMEERDCKRILKGESERYWQRLRAQMAEVG